jgi:DNA-3-methyladenine glycosylase
MMDSRRLGEAFYRQDVLAVAPQLVGKLVCRRMDDGSVKSGRILEAEAYRGEEDMACHARHGKTSRCAPLYETGGLSYVYLIYGLHWLFNVVTGEKDVPQAALIRALHPPLDGPAKWTKAFSITKLQNGLDLIHGEEMWLEDDGFRPQIKTLPRVGIDYAASPWKEIPWRFADEMVMK